MTVSSPFFHGSPRNITPIVVALLGYSTPAQINAVVRKQWPECKPMYTYRHLQDWKIRNWIMHAHNTQLWMPTVLGIECMQRAILKDGWVDWLIDAGYNYAQVKMPEPKYQSRVVEVDPNLFVKPTRT